MSLPDRLPLDRLRDGERLELVADDAERAAMADRHGLLALDRLEAHAAISRDGDVLHARGRLRAQLTQACIATGEACAQAIDEPFDLTFRPDPGAQPDEEIELAADELDTLFHDGQAIDLKAASVTDGTIVRINEQGDIEVRRRADWDVIGGLLGDYDERVRAATGLDWA